MGTIMSFPVILVLITSLLGSFFPFAGSPGAAPPAVDVTGHEGERTAAFLGADTDFYLTANLDPTDGQIDGIWSMVNGWWRNPNVQARWEEAMTESDDDSGIDVEEDVLPWLGPEVAVGVRNTIPAPDVAEDANAELTAAQAAIEACMADAMLAGGLGTLDGAVVGWDGSSGKVTVVADNITYDAADYLWGTFKAKYDVSVYGEITGATNVSWNGVSWDAAEGRWTSTSTPEETEAVAFFGTMNKTASDAFFEKFKAWQIEEQYYEYTYGSYWSKSGIEYVEATPYRGVKVVVGREYYQTSSSSKTTTDSEFYAFTDSYIITSTSQSALNRTIDLMKDGGTTLASTTNFKTAQAAMRADRLGMLFVNYGRIWDQVKAATPAAEQAHIDVVKSYFPSYYAAAIYLSEGGIALSAVSPISSGGPVITAGGPDLLKSATMVPEGALMFQSGQDINATWGALCAEIQENWQAIKDELMTGEGLPPGVTEADVASLNAVLAWVENQFGVDVNTDVFNWMTGEYSQAMLPFELDENGQVSQVDELVMFEVKDAAAVDASLDKLFDAVVDAGRTAELASVQNAVTRMMQENGLAAIEGVQTPTNDMGKFPDTTTTHGTAGVGWTIYHCDANGDGVYGDPYEDITYYWDTPTMWSYTCDNDGAVHQSGGPDYAWDSETIEGVEARLIPAKEEGAAAQRPGWLFLDVGTAHYLVIGSTTDALAAAVKANKGTTPSLDESATYKAVLSMLPETKMSLSYVDLTAYINRMMTAMQKDELNRVQEAVTRMMEGNGLTTIQGVQTPTSNMGAFPDATTAHGTAGQGWTIYHCDSNGDGQYSYVSGDRTYYYDNETEWSYTCDAQGNVMQHTDKGNEDALLAIKMIPLRAALGSAYALGPGSSVVVTGVLYLEPPALAEQRVPAGSSTVQIPEQTFDMSKLDVNIGKCSVKLDVAISNAPDGANIQIVVLDELPEDAISAFGLVATDGNAVILEVAYGIRVDKTGLTSGNVGPATLTMKVGRNWADAYGVDKIRIFRMSDGVKEVLPTEYKGPDGDYAVFEAVSTGGLSTFALAALKASDSAFTASDLVIDPGKVKTGKPADMSVTVANNSIVPGTYKVTLKINGEEEDSQSVALDPGASKTVTFTVTEEKAGKYEVDLNGLTGTLAVSKPTNWGLIGGLIGGGAAAVVLAVVAVLLMRRRRPEASQPSA